MRRRLITARPPFDATRARKPCVRARCRLCGWCVRFGISVLLYPTHPVTASLVLEKYY